MSKADDNDTRFIENPLLLLPPPPMLFAPAPSLPTFENTAQALLDPSNAPAFGLTLMRDLSDRPLTISTASGVNASAFLDRSGNVVIAFRGTTTSARTALDLQILSGTSQSTVQGIVDALRFATTEQQAARSEGIPPSTIHVGGYPPGGTLASLVASRTGLAGMSFASSGVPGYQAPAVPAANFVSHVGKGDPFASHGTDTAGTGSASADAAELAPFASAISGHPLQALEAGNTPAPAQVGADRRVLHLVQPPPRPGHL